MRNEEFFCWNTQLFLAFTGEKSHMVEKEPPVGRVDNFQTSPVIVIEPKKNHPGGTDQTALPGWFRICGEGRSVTPGTPYTVQ